MATSYANPGGTGDRTASIVVATDLTIYSGPINKMVDGSFADSLYFSAQAVAGKYISFDFGTLKVINEAKYYQSVLSAQGVWKWQGSNNGTTWYDIGGSFTLGDAATQTQTELSGNTTGYRYYRLLGVSGNTNNTPYIREIEFKIDNWVYIGTTALALTPQAETYGPHVYAGQASLALTPQSASAGTHDYTGSLRIRLNAAADYEPAGAGAATVIPASTGGWAMGGAGVWASSTPTATNLSEIADAEPTGFYLSGGAAPGEPEVISTIPGATEIVATGGFAFCGPGTTGDAATSFPASEIILPAAGFAMGGAGVWGQVAPGDLPSDALVPTGGFVLSGSGFTLDPGVTPTATVLVPTGGWKMGGRRPDAMEVTYPADYDRVIISSVALEMGGEGVWGDSTPESTLIDSLGAVLALGGAGLCTSKMPPSTAIVTGEGGFVLAGATPAEVFEAWVLSGQAFEPSVWSAFNFNSFAVHRGQAYAAGDDGIYLLGGDTDAGGIIHTGARIGPVNFGSDRDKRIRSVQYGQGGTGTRVRVQSEEGDVGVFAPDRDDNRVTVSRDIQGREFVIDLMDFSELSQLEITPLRLARR